MLLIVWILVWSKCPQGEKYCCRSKMWKQGKLSRSLSERQSIWMEDKKLIFQHLLNVVFFFSHSRLTRVVSEQMHFLSGQMKDLCHHHLTDPSGLSEEGMRWVIVSSCRKLVRKTLFKFVDYQPMVHLNYALASWCFWADILKWSGCENGV